MPSRSIKFLLLGFQLILAGGFTLLAFTANSVFGVIGLLIMLLGLLVGFLGFGMS